MANKWEVVQSMTTKYIANSKLLKASVIYHRNIPEEGETFLLQYHIAPANEHCKTDEIEHEGRCVIEDSHLFQSTPDTSKSDNKICD